MRSTGPVTPRVSIEIAEERIGHSRCYVAPERPGKLRLKTIEDISAVRACDLL
jgi:hypothetical protein